MRPSIHRIGLALVLTATACVSPDACVPGDFVRMHCIRRIPEADVLAAVDAQLASVAAAWHVPQASSEDYPALRLLDLVLTDGESSRLYRRLVDQDQTALSIWGDLGEAFDPTLYTLFAEVRKDASSAEVERALYEEIDRVAQEGIEERELQKAKNILLADFYRGLSTLSGKAQSLGDYEMFHEGWRHLFSAAQDYEKVSTEDLKRVAAQYLTQDNRTVVTLVPIQAEQADEKK